MGDALPKSDRLVLRPWVQVWEAEAVLAGTSSASEPPLARPVGESLLSLLQGGPGAGSRRPLTFAPCLHRANALEEQLKEQELRACEVALEEARRHRELVCKMERERSIEVESLQARWAAARGGSGLQRPGRSHARKAVNHTQAQNLRTDPTRCPVESVLHPF